MEPLRRKGEKKEETAKEEGRDDIMEPPRRKGEKKKYF